MEKANNGLSALYESCIAINAAGDIFPGGDLKGFPGVIHRSTDSNWTPVNNGLECGNIWRINLTGENFAGTAGCEDGAYRSTDDGESWALTNTSLTSTDIAGLGINNNGHIFAATRSSMGEGGDMFLDRLNNGDSWTKQNNGFNPFDANAAPFLQRGRQAVLINE